MGRESLMGGLKVACGLLVSLLIANSAQAVTASVGSYLSAADLPAGFCRLVIQTAHGPIMCSGTYVPSLKQVFTAAHCMENATAGVVSCEGFAPAESSFAIPPTPHYIPHAQAPATDQTELSEVIRQAGLEGQVGTLAIQGSIGTRYDFAVFTPKEGLTLKDLSRATVRLPATKDEVMYDIFHPEGCFIAGYGGTGSSDTFGKLIAAPLTLITKAQLLKQFGIFHSGSGELLLSPNYTGPGDSGGAMICSRAKGDFAYIGTLLEGEAHIRGNELVALPIGDAELITEQSSMIDKIEMGNHPAGKYDVTPDLLGALDHFKLEDLGNDFEQHLKMSSNRPEDYLGNWKQVAISYRSTEGNLVRKVYGDGSSSEEGVVRTDLMPDLAEIKITKDTAGKGFQFQKWIRAETKKFSEADSGIIGPSRPQSMMSSHMLRPFGDHAVRSVIGPTFTCGQTNDSTSEFLDDWTQAHCKLNTPAFEVVDCVKFSYTNGKFDYGGSDYLLCRHSIFNPDHLQAFVDRLSGDGYSKSEIKHQVINNNFPVYDPVKDDIHSAGSSKVFQGKSPEVYSLFSSRLKEVVTSKVTF